MKIHNTLLEASREALNEIFSNNRYADKVLEKTFRQNKRYGSRDRKFIAELVYDIVRWKRKYEYIAGTNNINHLMGVWFYLKNNMLPDNDQFKNVEIKKFSDPAVASEAIRESVPDWLYELGVFELKDKWSKELHALNCKAPLVLRTNTLKITTDKLKIELLKENISSTYIRNIPDALEVTEKSNVFSSNAFKSGFFEVQDASSQLVATFLNPLPGERVIDACAGAGGKTLHIAALMKNRGRVIAMDIEQYKLDELKKRAARAGVNNAEARIIQSSKDIKKMAGTADKLLLDAPCSGLGVLKRNPDAKWKLSNTFINDVRLKQQSILKDYSIMIKPGGELVYATCSILPSENRIQINTFLNSNQNFEFAEDKTVLPSEGYDGFYMCRIKRVT